MTQTQSMEDIPHPSTDPDLRNDDLRRLHFITDNVPVYLVQCDLQNRFTFVNKPYADRQGLPVEEIIGKTISDVVGEQAYKSIQPYIERTLRGEKIDFSMDIPYRKFGFRLMHCTFIPEKDDKGITVGFLGIIRDVTVRRQTELRMAFLVDLDDKIRPLTNPEEITQMAAKLLGEHLNLSRCAYADVESDQDTFNLTGDYINGVPRIVDRYTFTQFGNECLRLMREGKPYIVEDALSDPRTELVRQSYLLTKIRAVICVSLLKNGRFVAAMAVHQDVPRQWRTDEVDLVQQVASRCWESIERARVTRELRDSERRLLKQAEDLKNSNRELEQFAYVSSHDLQEPLRKISAYAQILEQKYRSKLDEIGSKYLDNISTGAMRMQNLIKGLLQYSQLGKVVEAKEQEVQLNKIMRDVLDNLDTTIRKTSAQILVAPLPTVIGNPLRLSQLFQNLIANALKFQRAKVIPQIEISASETPIETIIAVKDNGIGFDLKYADQIFKVFQRLHIKEKFEGTGIGLAISKKIAEQHGGRIWVNSELGIGSTFFVALPKKT